MVAGENGILAKIVEGAWSVDEDRSTLFKSASGDESNNKKLTAFADQAKKKKTYQLHVPPALDRRN